MNLYTTIAALLCVAIGLAHSVLGERYILIRLFRRDDLPRLLGSDWFTRRTLRMAWHLTSVAWWGFGAVLLAAGQPEINAREILLIVAWTFGVNAVAAAGWSRGRHLSWIVFLAIALLAAMATRMPAMA